MKRNPYSAPASGVGAAEHARALKKPLALSLMQFAMFAVAGSTVMLLLSMGFLPESTGRRGAEDVIKIAAALAWALAILVTSVRRQPVVRLLGGGLIVLMIASSIAALLTPVTSSSTHLVVSVAVAAECYWLYAFAFSSKAKRYLGVVAG